MKKKVWNPIIKLMLSLCTQCSDTTRELIFHAIERLAASHTFMNTNNPILLHRNCNRNYSDMYRHGTHELIWHLVKAASTETSMRGKTNNESEGCDLHICHAAIKPAYFKPIFYRIEANSAVSDQMLRNARLKVQNFQNPELFKIKS